MAVRVVSYNLLVPMLAEEPGYYFKCHPRFLKKQYRLNLIQHELQQEINRHRNTIVCLQELSRGSLPEMQAFFRRSNYTLIHKLYGERYNDYMGVGIAVPISMKLNSVSMIRVADQLRSRLREKQANILSLSSNLKDLLLGKSVPPQEDAWDIAMNKSNVLIVLTVVIDRMPLCVGTYHMPCDFKTPEVMMIHSALVKDLMLEIAGGQNLILAGDFNIKPSEKSYRVITERGYVHGRLSQPNNYTLSYRPNAEQVLKSAYRERNGVEPAFTNFAATSKTPYFCATLDYIFFHGRLMVEDVLQLPSQPRGESYPDATHPSDHLMIAASFRFI